MAEDGRAPKDKPGAMPPPLSDEEFQRRLTDIDSELDAAFRAQRSLPHPACLGCALAVIAIVVIVVVVLGLSWLGVIK